MSDQENTSRTLAEILKKAREEKNLSIEYLSAKTKINSTMLQRLEESDFKNLPQKAYMQGYVKSLAKELELDTNSILEVLEEDFNAFHGTKKESNTILKQNEEIEETEKKKFITIAVAGLASVVLLVIIFNGVFTKRKNEAKQVIEPKKITSNTPLKKDSPADNSADTDLEPSNKAEELKKLALEETENKEKALALKEAQDKKKTLALKEAEDKKKAKALKESEDKKKALASKGNNKATEKDDSKVESSSSKYNFYLAKDPLFSISSDSEKLSKVLPPGMKSQFTADENIFITAVNETTWLTYQKDSEKVRKVLLQKGKNLLIRGSKVKIFLGNVAGVEVVYNGNLINAPSKSGVKSLLFPETLRAEIPLPLFIYNKDGTVTPSSDFIKENNITL